MDELSDDYTLFTLMEVSEGELSFSNFQKYLGNILSIDPHSCFSDKFFFSINIC